MSDDELIGYSEIHCRTERALFNAHQINRMVVLAGVEKDNPPLPDGWYSVHEEMQELADLARANKESKPCAPLPTQQAQ